MTVNLDFVIVANAVILLAGTAALLLGPPLLVSGHCPMLNAFCILVEWMSTVFFYRTAGYWELLRRPVDVMALKWFLPFLMVKRSIKK